LADPFSITRCRVLDYPAQSPISAARLRCSPVAVRKAVPKTSCACTASQPDQMSELVRAGFAARTTERVLGEWRQVIEVKRLKITQAGERALGGQQ
jgi:hypothetical protein